MTTSASRLITIVGPTASGKTAFAVQLASAIGDGEIISGDSRQVYRGMDIGTGKDLSEYTVGNKQIPFHLIDIREAGEKYTLFDYQRDFHRAYGDVLNRRKTPILCGGTGLYIESVLKGYRLLDVPENKELRQRLAPKTLSELTDILRTYKSLHNTTDVDTCNRAIRAIEIADFQTRQSAEVRDYDPVDSLIIGIDIDRDERRRKISARLSARLQEGMIDEVRRLIDSGVAPDDLIYYGLEYKFVTLHVLGRLSYDDMFTQLETAIHQFAKRQMTWFRGMQRRGFVIHWLDASLPMGEKIGRSLSLLQN